MHHFCRLAILGWLLIGSPPFAAEPAAPPAPDAINQKAN